MKQDSLSHRKSGFLANFIPNSKERERVNLFLVITICIILAEVLFIFLSRHQLMTQDFRQYKGTFKQFGSIAQIGFYAVLSIYPIFLLLKYKKIKGIKWLKTFLQMIGKLVRKWHVPVALLSTGVVFLHAYMAILRGFKLDFTYISGMITTLLLLPLLFMGLMRFKRNDRNWHKKLAIIFLVLFFIHANLT
jgi:cytochrome b561